MPLYKVQLRGENFLLNLTGEPELLGFEVTHYVKARSEAEAERIAIIMTRKSQYLSSALLNTPQNPTRLSSKAVKRIWWPFGRKGGRYAFWEMASPAPAGQEPDGS